MQMRLFGWVAVASVFCTGITAHATDLFYLSTSAIDIHSAVAAYPPPGSTESRTDLQEILDRQASRTSSDCARASSEVHVSLNSFFGAAYGPLTTVEVIRLTVFFTKIMSDASYFIGTEKDYWQRPRPYQEDSTIRPCIALESSYAYPSGHTTIARVWADVLDLIDPTRKAAFDARALQVGQDRVTGGVHHPTDISAGILFGDLIFAQLQASPTFMRALNSARTGLHLHPSVHH